MIEHFTVLCPFQEVYDEIIAKSKAARAQRAVDKDNQEDKLEELDSAFKDLHGALNFRPTKWFVYIFSIFLYKSFISTIYINYLYESFIQSSIMFIN